MKILVNTGFLPTHNTQYCRYFFYEIFKRIVEQNQQDEFYFLVTSENKKDFSFGLNSFTVIIKQPLYKQSWIMVKLPLLLRSIKPQIIIQPEEYFNQSIKIPQVLMVCDNFSLSKKIKNANNIITTTESLKKKINEKFGIEEKINTVFAAPDEVFKPATEIIKRKTKDEFSFGYEYFLFVDETGLEEIFIAVLKAFSVFKNKQQSNMKLLVLSDDLINNKTVAEKIKTYKHRDDVVLLDDLNEQTIAEIIASAYTVLYLPSHDNSSLPIMWAMQSGVPVITSKNSSAIEIANSAALFVDELNYKIIAEQILFLYKDENKKNVLVEKGLQHVSKFNWNDSAILLWRLILKAID